MNGTGISGGFTGELCIPVQRRKHKKKRINKKWLKRYGYRIVYAECKMCGLQINEDGTYLTNKMPIQLGKENICVRSYTNN